MHPGVGYPNMGHTASMAPLLMLCWSTPMHMTAIPCSTCRRPKRAVVQKENRAGVDASGRGLLFAASLGALCSRTVTGDQHVGSPACGAFKRIIPYMKRVDGRYCQDFGVLLARLAQSPGLGSDRQTTTSVVQLLATGQPGACRQCLRRRCRTRFAEGARTPRLGSPKRFGRQFQCARG
jgi:hypothetical protein